MSSVPSSATPTAEHLHKAANHLEAVDWNAVESVSALTASVFARDLRKAAMAVDDAGENPPREVA